MNLDNLLRAHGFMRVERPAQLWDVDTEDTRLVPLMGEMLASGLSNGATLDQLTLSVLNVTVPIDPDDESIIPPGDFVAMTVRSPTTFGPDSVWIPSMENLDRSTRLGCLDSRLRSAGVRYAYIRDLPNEGSFTVFLSALR